MDRKEQQDETNQMAEVGLHPTGAKSEKSTLPIPIQRTASEEEKMPAAPPSEVPEKAIFSPVSPITDYNLRPAEAPQVISSSPKFIAVDEKKGDPAENAPIVAGAPPEYIENLDSPTGTRELPTNAAAAAQSPGDESSSSHDAEKQTPERKKKAMVCGLPAKLFYTFLAIGLLIVVGGAVGGGVGGSLASKRTAEKEAEAAAASASAAADADNSDRPEDSEDTEDRPTIEGYYLELYSGQNFTGAMTNITRFGEFKVNFEIAEIDGSNTLPPSSATTVFIPQPTDGTTQEDVPRGDDAAAKSYVWVPRDTGACVRFCNEGEATGYRCQGETHQGFPSGAGQFDKVILDFGGAPEEARCKD